MNIEPTSLTVSGVLDRTMMSLSADTLDSILPVQLEPEVMRDYQATFFPPRKPGKGVHAKRQHYPEMYQILGQASAVANAVLALSRFIYMELALDAAAGAGAGLLNDRLQRQWTAIVAEDGLTPAFAATSVRTAMGSASSGQAHVILPSTRYKDGFDVIYSGVPNGAYGRTSTVFSEKPGSLNQLPMFESAISDTQRNSDFATLAVDVAKRVNMWVFNSNAPVEVAMDDRHVQQIRMDQKLWDVSALQASLDQVMKKAGFAGGFPKIDTRIDIPADLILGLGDYFSFAVVKEPNHTYLQQRIVGRMNDDPNRTVPRVSADLQAEFGFCIAMNLKPELANFITQTEKGQRVSLVSLNTWVNAWSRALIKQRGTKFNKAKGGDKLTPAAAPRYILRPSGTASVSKRRKDLGLYTESTRGNEDGIYINNQGRFNYCPPSDQIVTENAKSYEEKQERALQLSYSVGAPLISSQVGSAAHYFGYKSEEYAKEIRGAKADLTAYAGALQTFSWDYNCILTSSRSDPDRLVSINLAGASRPDSLALSEYLKQPFSDAVFRLFPDNEMPGVKEISPDDLRDVKGLLSTSIFNDIFEAYQYMLYQGLAPDLQTLVDRAAKAMDYKSLLPGPGQEGEQIEYDLRLYTPDGDRGTPIVTTDLKITPGFTLRKFDKAEKLDETGLKYLIQSLQNQTNGIKFMLERAMEDATGRGRSNLASIASRDGSNIEDDPHYFDLGVHNLGDFNRLYNYFGGRVFFEMIQVLLKADVKDLAVVRGGQIRMPSFDSVVKVIKPFATMFGKYVPNHERLNAEGEAISESLKKDQSVTMDDIGLPGSNPGFQLFPHQAETFKTLGQEKPPRFAFLDIAPGGGKTALGLTDIGNLIRRGLIKRPVVLCPNGLVRNWIEDMHQFTDGKWNLIPITTMTYRTWGEERLTELIAKAPINTIFVVGLSFMRLNTYQIVIGNHAEKVSGTLEFCKKFGFDYVILDESHKAKNARSQTHKSIKQLTVASTVKYVRLATGTLIQTKLTDVVGQAALFGAHIFRTEEEYEAENSVPAGNGRATVFAADTPYRARRQLSKHVAVISFKKKEWAFLLPRPIESFFFVGLESADEDDQEGRAHQLMYRAILTETMEEIRADKKLVTLLSGGEDDEGPNEDDDEEISDEKLEELLSSGTRPGGMTTGAGDLDESQMAEVEAALRPYLQRLEMSLTDPMGDHAIRKYFEEAGLNTNYVSRKVHKIIERVNLNFKNIPWEKGATYKLKDVVDFQDTRYVLMGEPGKKLTLDSYSETYVSRIEPNRDPRWKPEPMGKVIVFCRYTRSVNAVLKALPPHLKKLAVGFSGSHKDKWQNLEAFRTTPFSTSKGVQILVANEQAISEGHNLQMASRIVRVESPWSPGELDQSSSRIFRPDTTGKFRRENAYLDWVLCNGTLEVAKLGRIVSRQIDKTKFDEADNPLYDPLAETTLVPISMSLETIAATPNLSDIEEYLEVYEKLVRIQSAEFEEMRQTRPSSMLPVEPTEMPEGWEIIEHVPYLPTMKSVPDRHNFGLIKLTSFLQDDDDEQAVEANNNKQLLVGQYAHTEFGNGMIVGLREAKNPDGPTKLTSVRVQLANGDEYTADPAMIYLAQNVTKETAAQFTPKNRWSTAADKKRAEREERARDRELEREERRLQKAADREAREAKRLKKQDEAERSKKKVKVPKNTKAPKVVEEEVDEDDNLIVELYPVVYGGYLAVEARPGDHEPKELKQLGFKAFGDYAYLQIKDKISFDALIAWLEKKFYLRRETAKRLEKLAESFQSGRGRKFAVELAPHSEFKNFYYISHKLSMKDKESGKPELKIYPVILNGALFLNVDISTNPVIRKYLNKPIPGTKNLKFQEAESLYIQFFKTRNEVVAWTKKTLASGVEIQNLQEFKDEVDGLKEKLKVMQKLTK